MYKKRMLQNKSSNTSDTAIWRFGSIICSLLCHSFHSFLLHKYKSVLSLGEDGGVLSEVFMRICVEDSPGRVAGCQALGGGLTISIVIRATVLGEVRRLVNDCSGLRYESHSDHSHEKYMH